mmetsp:Transcript_41153/g.72410  ORF Transcript_41153/g.72410 Transcript_41153/m.72410 type:complete len:96 (-) Transcript_41153:30-317(-)
MRIWAWLYAREVLRSQLEVASAERGSFVRTIILAVDAGTPAVRGEVLPAIFMSCICWGHAERGKLLPAELRGCCQSTSLTDGRGELLSASFVAEG